MIPSTSLVVSTSESFTDSPTSTTTTATTTGTPVKTIISELHISHCEMGT